MIHETILNVFPTQDDKQRLVMVLKQEAGGSSLVLRQESFSDDIGWFVQSRIDVQSEQVAGLRASLSSNQISRASLNFSAASQELSSQQATAYRFAVVD